MSFVVPALAILGGPGPSGALAVEQGSAIRRELTSIDGRGVVASDSGTVPDQGYRVYGGLGMGVGVMDGAGFESTPTGSNFLGSIGLGRRTGRWEWDGAIGWGFSNRGGVDNEGMGVGIKIRSARADGCARYRLWRGWAIGPMAAIQFGTDTRQSATLGDSNITPYVGSRTTIDLPTAGGVSLQLWGEALTEVSRNAADAFAGMVGVRIGVPVDFSRRDDSISTSQSAPSREVRVVLDGSRIFFGSNSSSIRPQFKKNLEELAGYLAASTQAWESVSIEGHADRRGRHAYNVELSRRRAREVEKALLSAGISSQRTSVEAFGPDRPLDGGNDRRALARNRRVELIFRQVANPQELASRLAPLTVENIQTTRDPNEVRQ